MKRFISQAFLVTVAALLVVNPSLVTSRRRTAEEEVYHRSESGAEIPPVAMIVAGTVSVAGSLFSIHKHKRQIAMDRKQKAFAEEIVSDYQAQQDKGCRMLDQTAVLMGSKRQALQRLASGDRNKTETLTNLRMDEDLMKEFEEYVKVHLLDSCHSLEVEGASSNLSQFGASCLQAANFESLAERISEETGHGLPDAMRRADLEIARLDGVMAGLCDGLPDFKRSVVKQGVGSSLIAREVNEIPMNNLLVYQVMQEQARQADVLDMIALSYSVLGALDFGFDLYESAVHENRGYAILLDVVQQNFHRQQQLLWNSFRAYWLDVAWMRSVQLATLAERYQAASLSLPDHFWGMKRADTPLRWLRFPYLDFGMTRYAYLSRYWACSQKMKCLVPVWHEAASDVAGDEQDRSELASCATSFGDMKMCRTLGDNETNIHEPVKVFGIAPRRCFGVGFGGQGLSSFLKRNIWIFHFGSNGGSRGHAASRPGAIIQASGDDFREAECLDSLRSLAQSTVAESSLRGDLVALSKESGS